MSLALVPKQNEGQGHFKITLQQCRIRFAFSTVLQYQQQHALFVKVTEINFQNDNIVANCHARDFNFFSYVRDIQLQMSRSSKLWAHSVTSTGTDSVLFVSFVLYQFCLLIRVSLYQNVKLDG